MIETYFLWHWLSNALYYMEKNNQTLKTFMLIYKDDPFWRAVLAPPLVISVTPIPLGKARVNFWRKWQIFLRIFPSVYIECGACCLWHLDWHLDLRQSYSADNAIMQAGLILCSDWIILWNFISLLHIATHIRCHNLWRI